MEKLQKNYPISLHKYLCGDCRTTLTKDTMLRRKCREHSISWKCLRIMGWKEKKGRRDRGRGSKEEERKGKVRRKKGREEGKRGQKKKRTTKNWVPAETVLALFLTGKPENVYTGLRQAQGSKRYSIFSSVTRCSLWNYAEHRASVAGQMTLRSVFSEAAVISWLTIKPIPVVTLLLRPLNNYHPQRDNFNSCWHLFLNICFPFYSIKYLFSNLFRSLCSVCIQLYKVDLLLVLYASVP